MAIEALVAAAAGGNNMLQPFINYGLGSAATARGHDRQKNLLTRRYQYLVGDLEKAGLNRMLAIGGAQPPSASVPVQKPSGSGVVDPAVASNLATARELRNTQRAQQRKLAADTVLSGAATARELSQKDLNEKLADRAVAEAHRTVIDSQLMKTREAGRKAIQEFEENYPWMRIIKEYIHGPAKTNIGVRAN